MSPGERDDAVLALAYGLERTAEHLVSGDPVERAVWRDLLVGAVEIIDERDAARLGALFGG